ncbi:DUF4350 domain-containing protein [Cryobacterium sp. PH31-O1]|uniref:DUF4350 domain-containing protein n=1 Tax=Cryobacterium sp. PH31-O1 TaxID=3046306 RepID=UPI0024BAA267|nr:DUF4350 domain-containing protein [Cryobacterium sp. PH31-O1]MDJ0339075.1 DUF4350 domain-containing protein [Cryobacterium sp. PH31-O1]
MSVTLDSATDVAANHGHSAGGVPTTVATPTLRALLRRSSFWIFAFAGIVIVAIVGVFLSGGSNAAGRALAGDNAAPAGSMALVEVLRQQGVTVTLADSLVEVRDAVGADSTVLLFDENGYLDGDQLAELAELAARTVVVAPDFLTLQALAATVGFGGVSDASSLQADCVLPAANRAGELLPGGDTLSIPAGEHPLVTGCFASSTDTFSLIQVENEATGGIVSLVPDARVFNNENVTGYGNAALALGLLGESDSLVWYLPTLADLPRTGPPSLAALTPGWVSPVAVLLVLAAVAAAFWRGRRFGPLVAENLPVTVKASETMEGRARLYARSNARLRALDALRVGTVQRLARAVGLGRLAHLEEVVGAVAQITGGEPNQVRRVLVDAIPSSDAQLMALSDALQALEQATGRAVMASVVPAAEAAASASRDSSPPPAERMDP